MNFWDILVALILFCIVGFTIHSIKSIINQSGCDSYEFAELKRRTAKLENQVVVLNVMVELLKDESKMFGNPKTRIRNKIGKALFKRRDKSEKHNQQ